MAKGRGGIDMEREVQNSETSETSLTGLESADQFNATMQATCPIKDDKIHKI